MAGDVVVLWLVEVELELAVAEVAGESREVLGVLVVAGVLGWKKLALDRNTWDEDGCLAAIRVGDHQNGVIPS